jgi:hypothetical protein
MTVHLIDSAMRTSGPKFINVKFKRIYSYFIGDYYAVSYIYIYCDIKIVAIHVLPCLIFHKTVFGCFYRTPEILLHLLWIFFQSVHLCTKEYTMLCSFDTDRAFK